MIAGVEVNPSAPGLSTPARTETFDGSKAFDLGELIDLQIECRRSAATGSSNASILARNLEKDNNYYGERLPCDTAAHHIVAAGPNVRFPQVRSSQQILAAFGIGINDAVNGVVLPDTRYNSNVPIPGYPHWGPGVHSGATHTRINTRLVTALQSINPQLVVLRNQAYEIDQVKLDQLKANDPSQVALIREELIDELLQMRNIFLSGSLP